MKHEHPSSPSPAPRARQENILAHELFDEYVIYDAKALLAHDLNPTATLVWQWCDGVTPAESLTERLAVHYGLSHTEAEALLWLALDRLGRANLLDTVPSPPEHVSGMTRRSVISLLAGASLLPVVHSMVVPPAAYAMSDCAVSYVPTLADLCGSLCVRADSVATECQSPPTGNCANPPAGCGTYVCCAP